ncbi:N-acetyltransferase [Methanosarcina sp.]|uniref:N-acetyltransferase n=1 Tax=Methanosarcina sp. TaxID=2213 RepID=UPI002ABA9EF4|nr:N-acetyltransferase [Methanosarcina sp.]MDY9926141.1 N-acetyltransferase [Methanosarcina sp.]
MIRTYRETDLEEMVRIWYDASVIAHPFMPASFWASHKSVMKEKYLPLAENYVFEQKGKVMGFISLVGEKVCALFIAPEAQERGTGKALLEHAKVLKGRLSLKVYRDNRRAIIFYEKSGFKAVGKEIDDHTGCVQVLMEWEI